MKLKSTLLSLLTTTAICSVGSIATATADEIVITGTGRPTALQDAPVSVTAFDSQSLDDARVSTVDGFTQLTAGVTFAKTQGPGTGFLTIRGLTQVRNSEPPVATIVDGVLQVNPLQFTQEFFDIDSIEVLRGPQGALYGRNATGGAIIINTKQPTNEVEGFVQAGYATGGEYSVAGSFSGPIVEDTLLFRVSARYLERDGYFDNFILNTEADPVDDVTLRGQLKYQVTENLEADLKGSIVRSSGGSLNFSNQFRPIDPVTGVAGPFSFANTIDSNLVIDRFAQNQISNSDRDLDQISLRLAYDAPIGKITSVTSYDTIENTLTGVADPYDSTFGQGAHTYTDVETLSQELRITSPDEQAFRWIFGAYYLDTERFRADHTTTDLGLGILPLGRLPSTNPDNPSVSYLASDNNNTAWAVFANFDYDINEWLELYFGVRYDEDERERITPANVTAGLPTGCTTTTPAACVDKATFDALQPKVSLTAKVNENFTAYASWGEGFRSGQYNNSGTAAAAASLTPPLIGVNDLAGQEDTETFEVGFKSSLLDNRVTLNGAAFHSTVEGQHYFEFVGAIGAQIIINLDEVELQGFELEATAELVDGLDAYASYSYMDSEIKAYALNPTHVGNEAPYVPDSTFNIGAQYRGVVNEQLGYFGRLDYERRGEQHWSTGNTWPRDALELVNVRLGLEDPDGGWALTAAAENATDEIYNSEFTGGYSYAGIPRVYRVDLRLNF